MNPGSLADDHPAQLGLDTLEGLVDLVHRLHVRLGQRLRLQAPGDRVHHNLVIIAHEGTRSQVISYRIQRRKFADARPYR